MVEDTGRGQQSVKQVFQLFSKQTLTKRLSKTYIVEGLHKLSKRIILLGQNRLMNERPL